MSEFDKSGSTTGIGILKLEDLKQTGLLPSPERFRTGPVVIVECVQEIPCNPCETACPQKAILVGEDITAIPKVDFEACNGCTLCISQCPGLAIFCVDLSEDKETAEVSLPYEYLPRPIKGQKVKAFNRAGQEVAMKCLVTKVLDKKKQGKTAIITIEVPRELAMDIRHIEVSDDNQT